MPRKMNIHFVVHEIFEAPGAYEEWALQRGHAVSYSHVHQGDALPHNVDTIDMLIVMGGPQSPATTIAECPHFDSLGEQALIADAVNAGKAVVGVCLGAQLLGEALGAAHGHSPEKEIGKFPITLTDAGLSNPKFTDFGRHLDAGHWHGDMPGLTEKAIIIATSEGCPRQIVEYGPLVYGFQCHMEFTPAVVERLIEASGPDLAASANRPFVQQPDILRSHDWREMNARLAGFLDRLAANYRDGVS